MTIDEAIEYLKDLKKVELHKLNTYTPLALEIAIEGLDFIKRSRLIEEPVVCNKLLLETRE